MRNKAQSKKSQSGQILIYTTIILMLAALILVPLMNFTFSSHRSALIRTQRTLELYASDAGIEDALYQIKTEKNGTALATLPFGNTSLYYPGTPAMNDRTENVTVQKVWLPEGLPTNAIITNKPGNVSKNWTTPAPVNNDTPPYLGDTDKSDKLVVVGMLQTVQSTAAADDFDHGWPNGVSQLNGVNQGNWTVNWTTTGSAGSASGGNGGFCLSFTGTDGTAMRQTTLPKYMKPELKFDAKASSYFGSGGNASCQVSTDGSNWTTVATWNSGNGTYSSYDIDLYNQYGIGGLDTTSPLWIRFNANLSPQTVARDDFNSGGWSGGSGWYNNNAWTTSGSSSASVVNDGANAHSPNYDVQLSGTGYVMRRVSIPSSITNPQITLWAKTSSFSSSDNVYLKVSTLTSPSATSSSDWSGSNGVTEDTWNSSDSTSYTSYTYDLSAYVGKNIWILFSGNMRTTGTLAADGFESGWPGSGSGWAGSWTPSTSGNGTVSVVTGYAHGGSYALQLSRSGGTVGSISVGNATRILNVSGQNNVQLQFYARSRNIESSDDTLTLLLSADGSSWTSIPFSVSSSYPSLPTSINVFSYVPQGTTQLYIRFNASMTYSSGEPSSGSSSGDYFYIDDISVVGNIPCFYVDDVSITGGISFSVDNVWIGYQANSNDIEIAYTDPNFDLSYPPSGNQIVNDPAYLCRIGVWMPPGCEYIGVVGNKTTTGLNQVPDILQGSYAGGTILEWDFSPIAPNLGNSTGQSIPLPIVWDLTFSYSVPPTQVVEGMFVWIKATGGGGLTCLSWDHGYEIYKAISKAHSQILGTNTQVAAYVGQGAIDKNGAASYGDYVAAGAALLFDSDNDDIKDRAVNPSNNSTWVTYGGFFYDGRDQITNTPSDAKVTAAWLYWSAFMNTTDWTSSNSTPDKTVSFMYPMRYGPESYAVSSSGNLTYTVNSYTQSSEPYKESMDLLAHQPALTLSNMRYLGEVLGNATLGNSTPDSWLTLHKPILSSPTPNVYVRGVLKAQSGNYTINYATGNVTIINTNLSGAVTIDYSVSDTMTLANGTDYTINQNSGNDIRYTGFTIKNSQITGGKLQGTVTIDYYYAKHWVTVQHAAYDKYGTALSPAQTEVDDPTWGYVGNTYACFADVTQLLTGNGTYVGVTGDGQYAVGNVTATPGVSGSRWGTRSFSGWSLIVLYQSATVTYTDEVLGVAGAHNGNDVFFTLHKPILSSPAPIVKVGTQTLSPSGNYTIDYPTGTVTITNDQLSGTVSITYATGQTAHQFYLWDPIHNAAECPFMVQPNTDSSIQPPCIYVSPYVQVPFTLNDFYPPEGTVTGKLTYFVGEGDVVYAGDSVGFKGASQGNYTFLHDPNLGDPNYDANNVMNCLSTNGDAGVDIDTYNVTNEVGNDTQANVLLRTQGDRWYLTYMILSFKTNVVPPPDYSFNVASITYQYQLGGK